MLTTPILSPIIPFDATLDYELNFNIIGGSQVTKNNVVIVRVSDNVEVYNNTIETFSYTHKIPAYTLTNNVQYKVRVRTGDINNNYSSFSDWVLFYCYAPASISITNITYGGIANNQNYLFTGTYNQPYDPIKAYLFILYDENGVQLAVSPLKYSSVIEHAFVLQNNTKYNIELKTQSQSGVEVSTGLIPFTASYIAPQMGAELQLTNIKDDGAVSISIIAIQRNAEGSNYTFIGNDWIDLTANNAIVRFVDGINTLSNNYSIKLYFKNIPTNKTFLKIISPYGNIQVNYSENRFHAWQYAHNLVGHFINSNSIAVKSEDIVCLEIKVIGGLIDIFANIIS